MKSLTLLKQSRFLDHTCNKFCLIQNPICIIFIQQQKPRSSYFLIKGGNFFGKFGLCTPQLCPLDSPNFELILRLSTCHPFVIRGKLPSCDKYTFGIQNDIVQPTLFMLYLGHIAWLKKIQALYLQFNIIHKGKQDFLVVA